MTRGKRLSVVFAVVMLVVASGTALAMAASSNQANATISGEAQQGTTEAATQTQTQTEGGADVSLSAQETEGTVVTVDSVTLPEGGFVTVHDETLLDGDAVGSVIGVSQYLEPGTHEDVRVVLERPITETQNLIAMPHRDTNQNQVYGFIISGGETDVPYVSGGAAVVSNAEITVSGQAAGTTEAADGEVTQTETAEATVTEEPATETEAGAAETETEEAATETEAALTETETEVADGDEETTAAATETEAPATEEPATETPAEPGEGAQVPEKLVFEIEDMEIDEWSFVVGDSTEPDRTVVIGGFNLTDRTVELNLTKLATGEMTMQQAMGQQMAQKTTPAADDVNTSDIETVRYVIRDVQIENVTFVVTGLEQLQKMEEVPGQLPEKVPGVGAAQVEFENQSSDGTTVTIDRVTMSQGGFVAIHDRTLLDGDVFGSVVGVSEYLEAGTHRNVTVTLDEPLTESQVLFAMPHKDTNGNQAYDFVTSNGAEDGPYVTGGEIVVDPGMVTVEPETTEAVETTEMTETTEAVETTEAEETQTTEGLETSGDFETTVAEEETEVFEETTQAAEGTTEVAETTQVEETTQAGGAQAFSVENLQAPQTAAAGEVITVSATVTNVGDVQNTEEVDFRLQGDVVDTRTVTLDPGESREVTFEIDTSQLTPGSYVQGIYSDLRGQVAIVEITEGGNGNATTAAGEETTQASATTEATQGQLAVQVTA